MPAQYTCDGHEFASGDNPELHWTAGPTATKSYAIVLKDLSIVTNNASTSAVYNRGFHWVIWDIPTNIAFKIPHGMGDAEFPSEVPGARQWANRNQFGYFPPCPNNDPTADPSTHVTDNDSLTLYAIDKAILDYPAMDPNVVNYTRTIDDYIASVAIAKTELLFTSNARAVPAETRGVAAVPLEQAARLERAAPAARAAPPRAAIGEHRNRELVDRRPRSIDESPTSASGCQMHSPPKTWHLPAWLHMPLRMSHWQVVSVPGK
jgi:phosphatidylethanolamine-binding protein (PEBP) family uncharacterized protein